MKSLQTAVCTEAIKPGAFQRQTFFPLRNGLAFTFPYVHFANWIQRLLNCTATTPAL
jgi:hypothetical protein